MICCPKELRNSNRRNSRSSLWYVCFCGLYLSVIHNRLFTYFNKFFQSHTSFCLLLLPTALLLQSLILLSLTEAVAFLSHARFFVLCHFLQFYAFPILLLSVIRSLFYIMLQISLFFFLHRFQENFLFTCPQRVAYQAIVSLSDLLIQ